MKYQQYYIFSATTKVDLMGVIDMALKDGWVLVGGVAVSTYVWYDKDTETQKVMQEFYQACTMEKEIYS